MKQQLRLKISRSDFDSLQELMLQGMPRESGAFALAGCAKSKDSIDIIIRRIIQIPQELLRVQNEYRLELYPQAINGLISLCESNKLGAVLCHSHPSKSPYSSSDDYGEQRIFETLRQFIPDTAPTASLLFSPEGVDGRAWFADQPRPLPLSEIIIIGRSIERIKLTDKGQNHFIDKIYDRQVRAFGKSGQALIQQTKVGIVGVGGTGSATAEQLVRLGVEDFIIIDRDCFEISNITRMYGSNRASLLWSRWGPRGWRKNRSKVNILSAHFKQIRPNVKVQAVPYNIVLHEVAEYLLDRDIIFLCTDDHWGRSIVNQIAYQYFIPTINVGAIITAENNSILGANGVIDILRPDQPCLWCKEYLKTDRIRAESLPKIERDALYQEGYVQDIDTPAPSVISITTTVASMGVTLFLQLLTDFMGARGEISRQNYYILDGTVRRGQTMINANCSCQTSRAFGDLKTLPTVNDLSYLSN